MKRYNHSSSFLCLSLSMSFGRSSPISLYRWLRASWTLTRSVVVLAQFNIWRQQNSLQRFHSVFSRFATRLIASDGTSVEIWNQLVVVLHGSKPFSTLKYFFCRNPPNQSKKHHLEKYGALSIVNPEMLFFALDRFQQVKHSRSKRKTFQTWTQIWTQKRQKNNLRNFAWELVCCNSAHFRIVFLFIVL